MSFRNITSVGTLFYGPVRLAVKSIYNDYNISFEDKTPKQLVDALVLKLSQFEYGSVEFKQLVDKFNSARVDYMGLNDSGHSLIERLRFRGVNTQECPYLITLIGIQDFIANPDMWSKGKNLKEEQSRIIEKFFPYIMTRLSTMPSLDFQQALMKHNILTFSDLLNIECYASLDDLRNPILVSRMQKIEEDFRELYMQHAKNNYHVMLFNMNPGIEDAGYDYLTETTNYFIDYFKNVA